MSSASAVDYEFRGGLKWVPK